ncbi:unnamed protein product [Allacma fusca]|uniref:Uncharacterized protein n=1 Tax=Allacma fusca TaxID=39272 RepID=A0A8J2JR90_9HEXA|nr:unnamed protein product [Allacma fusca]
MARLQRSLKGAALQTVQGMMISPENLDIVLRTLEISFGRPDIIIRTLIEKARKTPSPKEEKLKMLITFSNAVQNLVATMRVLKVTLEHFADWITNAASITSILIQESEAKPAQKRDGKGKKTDSVSPSLKKISVDERWNIVTDKKLCFHCLRKGCQLTKHTEKECGVDTCNKFHHELLHKIQMVKKEFTAHVSQSKFEVLLCILPVTLTGPKASVHTYALCDEASTVTLLESSLVEDL